jgi:CNP1-like family
MSRRPSARQDRTALRALAKVTLLCLLAWPSVQAQQLLAEELAPELPTPAPPAFNLQKLIFLPSNSNSALRVGVDPATLVIGTDDVVRYVVVAISQAGNTTAQFEGIRCRSAEAKVYARFNADSQWSLVKEPQWRSLFEPAPSNHTLQLARGGVCASASANTSVARMVEALKGGEAKP